MKAVILAAGFGTRMKKRIPKPLIKVAGREIIYRTMNLLSKHVDEFIIVVGKNGDKIDAFLMDKEFKYTIIWNPNPERGNGYSFYLTKEILEDISSDKFVLVMGDHVYEGEFVDRAIEGFGLIVDKNPRYVDLNEATKVKCEGGRVIDIGKNLEEFDCVDTGFFILSKDIYKFAEELVNEKEVIELSEIIKKARIPVTEVSGYFWMDVDTRDDVKRARKFLVRNSIKGVGDGFISRILNRKISVKFSEILVDHVTPNQMTLISFFVGMLSSIVLFFNIPTAALLYQLSSIIDGCDGEIARASLRKSRIGEYIDSVLDRYVDFMFLVILAYISAFNTFMWFVLACAVFGSVMVSYSTEKYKSAFFENVYARISSMKYLIGKRDERIFVIMLFCLFGFMKELIILLALWTNLRVVLTVLIVYIFKNKNKIK
ncbi:CDP-alcohol phosphatidyltransferase [Archaeoglobales archaeon]|nr:MAG: CDP-alcohol phosphatidyltransferase [Archaeoglobales archaeon]